MFALARGTIIVDCNGRVENSTIVNSQIDMNGGVITSHGLPTNLTDVVNKEYVDSLATGGGIPLTVVNLTATNYSLPINILSGSLLVLIKNNVAGGPSATFLLSKSEQYMEPSISRFTSSAGNTTNERLRIKWEINTGIQIRKTGNNYDGQYYVKYISV